MKNFRLTNQQIILLAGDFFVLFLVTLYGFASHNELTSAGLYMLTTFVPLLVAWLLIAPHLKVYQEAVSTDLRQVWRPFWAMVLAAPMASWLRGVWLGQPILPLFVVIIGGVSALAILAWRALYAYAVARKKPSYG